MMSALKPEHHSVEIHKQEDHEEKKIKTGTGSDPNPNDPPLDPQSTLDNSSSMTQQVTGWRDRLKNCLHNTGKSINGPEEDEKTEEGKAYKKLMEDLEAEAKENPISINMYIANAIIFVVFIILATTFATVHVIHVEWLLNVKIYSWVMLLMVAVSGYPIIRFVTYLISEPVVWVWKMNKYVLFFARKLKKSVDVTLWFTLMLWVWYTWFRPQIKKDVRGASTLHVPVKEYQEVVRIAVKQTTRLLMALTIGAFIWTVKSAVFLKLLADLHFKELSDRIRQTILDFHGIQFIEKKSWEFLTKTAKSNNNEGVGKGSSEIVNEENNNNGHPKKGEKMSFWMCIARLKKQTVPIWILKRLTYAYTEHMRKSKPQILHGLEHVDDDEKLMEEAKEMLMKVIDKDHLDDISRSDLRKYGLEDNEINFVLQLFTSKDGKPREKITQDEFLRWAVLAVRNCLGLERIIESSKHVFFKLDVLMSSCVVVITLVIWLLLSELVNTGQIAILFAPFLSASFIFGESLKNSFDGLMFVFGMHPFDVGDRVIIEDVEMKVSEINILTTIFIKYDTGVEAHYPNSVLATKVIVNLDITPDQPDSIEFTVPIETPQELICDMQVKIKKILDDNLTFTSDTVVSKLSITEQEVTLKVYFKYLVSYLSAETKAQHRSKILCKIIKLREQLKKEMPSKKEDKDSSQQETSILRFEIDVQAKLSEIEELKNKIMTTLYSYNPGLKDGSQVLFTKINKAKITMDVRMRHSEDLLKTDDEKNELKEQIELAIKEDKLNQGKENVKVSWLPKPDLEDDC